MFLLPCKMAFPSCCSRLRQREHTIPAKRVLQGTCAGWSPPIGFVKMSIPYLARWVLQATCVRWDSPSRMYTSARAAQVASSVATSGSPDTLAALRLRFAAGSASAFRGCLPNSIASSSCSTMVLS